MDEMKAMVSEVNANEVRPNEVLSNEVYFWDGKGVSIVETKSRGNAPVIKNNTKQTVRSR